MTIQKSTVKALRALASELVIDRPDSSPIGPWFTVPEELQATAKSMGIDPQKTVAIKEASLDAWNRALEAIAREPDFEHLDDAGLENELKLFAWKILINYCKTKDIAARNETIGEFVRSREEAVKSYRAIVKKWTLSTSEMNL